MSSQEAEVLVNRLSSLCDLSDDDKEILRGLQSNVKTVQDRSLLARQGDRQTHSFFVISGLVLRVESLDNGNRQIVSYVMPGDFSHNALWRKEESGYFLETRTKTEVIQIATSKFSELNEHPQIAKAFARLAYVETNILRKWISNMGGRNAEAKIANLICELHRRLAFSESNSNVEFDLPLTQTDLAESLGISTVHTNRSLMKLREAGLMRFKSSKVWIPNVKTLEDYVGFNADYLHA